MRLQVKHVVKMKNDALELQQAVDSLVKYSDRWTNAVTLDYDQYTTSLYRRDLEREIVSFRRKLGELYDHMSERGLKEAGTG